MDLPYPRVSLHVTGTDIRVFGDTDVIERTAGIKPNVVTFRVSKTEYDKLSADYTRCGDLELWFTPAPDPANPDDPPTPEAPDVILAGYWIDWVEDTVIGQLPDSNITQTLEKIFYLVDRRYEFLDGFGGHISLGLINRSNPDGSVSNPSKLYNGNPVPLIPAMLVAGIPLDQLLVVLASKLKFRSGLNPWIATDPWPDPGNDGLPIHNQDSCPTYNPPDVNLDGVHVPSVMAKLMDDAEVGWFLINDGTYCAEPFGCGELPSIDPAKLIPTDLCQPRPQRAANVVITSAPRRTVVREEYLGPVDDVSGVGFQFVGRDTDDTLQVILPGGLSQLTYGQAKNCVQLVQEDFKSLSDVQFWAAVRSVYTVIRLDPASLANCLPFVASGMATVTDPSTNQTGTSVQRSMPAVRVWAKTAVESGGTLTNSDTFLEQFGFNVDPIAGTISFSKRLARVTQNGVAVADAAKYFSPLTAGQIKVQFSHEYMANRGAAMPWKDFFTMGFQSSAGGIVSMADDQIDACISGDDADCKVILAPELGLVINPDATSNATNLGSYALKIATRYLASTQVPARIYRWQGFQNVNCNGNIVSVKWKIHEGITECDYRTYFLSKNRVASKEALAKLLRGVCDSNTMSTALPANVSQGRSQYAQPLFCTPDCMGSPPSGLTLAYGMLVSMRLTGGVYDGAVTVNPCNADGTGVDASTSVILAVQSPAILGALWTVPTGTVLTYVKTTVGSDGTITGLVVGFPHLPNPSAATAGQVLILDANKLATWNWLRWT